MGAGIKSTTFRTVALWGSAAAMVWLLWRFTLPVTLLSVLALLGLRLAVYPREIE